MRWCWIVFFWIVMLFSGAGGEAVPTPMAVVAGEQSRQAAEGIAVELRRLISEQSEKSHAPVRVGVDRVGGLWLVEVGPLGRQNAAPDPLLSTLAERYPGMLLLSRGASSSTEAGKFSPSAHSRRGYPGTVTIFGFAVRWEWLALLFMALAGGLWLQLRARRLGRMEDEQKRLEYRQNSIRARLRQEGGDF